MNQVSRTRQGELIDVYIVGQRTSYRTRELIDRIDRIVTENAGKRLSLKKIVEMQEVKQIAFIVGEGEDTYPCGADQPILVPGITAELLLKAIKIVARCHAEKQPARSLVLLTDKLSPSIETYTAELFEIAGHLEVLCVERWYLRSQ